MDPISEAISAISVTNIMLAGALGIAFALILVNVRAVQELLNFGSTGDVAEEDERYDYFLMSEVAESKTFTDEDWDKYKAYESKYGEFSDADYDRFYARYADDCEDYYDDNTPETDNRRSYAESNPVDYFIDRIKPVPMTPEEQERYDDEVAFWNDLKGNN